MKKSIIFILVSFLSSTVFAQVVDFTDITVETEQKVLMPKDPVGRVFANIHYGERIEGLNAIGAHAGWFKTHGAYIGINKSISTYGKSNYHDIKSMFSMSAGWVFSPARSRKTGLLQSNWFQLYLGLGPTFLKDSNNKVITKLGIDVGTMYTLGCGLNFLCGLAVEPFASKNDPDNNLAIGRLQLGIGWTFGKNKN
ncbi:MAG: hypothetical protein MJY45_05535 [Bacteroidales bacterium]|nr:hypothetical protein [Bacteroidales bacterium]